MAQVICEVTPGIRDEAEKTVAVRDVHGRKVFLRVEEDYLSKERGVNFLPVGIVGFDNQRELALIELPHESDSGVNRLWVNVRDLHEVGEPVT